MKKRTGLRWIGLTVVALMLVGAVCNSYSLQFTYDATATPQPAAIDPRGSSYVSGLIVGGIGGGETLDPITFQVTTDDGRLHADGYVYEPIAPAVEAKVVGNIIRISIPDRVYHLSDGTSPSTYEIQWREIEIPVVLKGNEEVSDELEGTVQQIPEISRDEQFVAVRLQDLSGQNGRFFVAVYNVETGEEVYRGGGAVFNIWNAGDDIQEVNADPSNMGVVNRHFEVPEDGFLVRDGEEYFIVGPTTGWTFQPASEIEEDLP